MKRRALYRLYNDLSPYTLLCQSNLPASLLQSEFHPG